MKTDSQIASEGVLIFNDQGNIGLVNPTANQLFGYEKDELLGLSIEKLIPGGLSAIHKDHPEIASDHNGHTTGERIKLNGVKKEGDELLVDISLNQFQGGNEFFTVGFISEADNTATAGENSTDENLTPVIFLVLDKSANISLINKYGCQLLGCPEDALKGLNWFENFLPYDKKEALQVVFEKAFITGKTENYESPLLTLKGERYTFLWTTTVINDSSGVPVATLSTGIDAGKKVDKEIDLNHIERIRKLNMQLELNVKKHTQELVNSLANVETINRDLQLQIQKRKAIEEKLIKFQRLYDTMVHNFPDGVIGVLNRDMKYVLIDGKDLNEIDLPALGLTGQKVSESQDPALAEETLSKIKKAFDGQSVSFEVKTKDRFYNIAAVPLPDAQNNINEILCVLKNVTERKRMEDGLLKALEKEKELGELKSRFVTMASHEFKTPLATILSSTFLLENYSGVDYDKEKMVHTNRIKRSVNNLTMILNEFLSLEKLEENQVKIVNTKINISKFIRDVISEVEPVKKKDQVIDYQHSGVQQTVYLDPHVLWSIITNLISNALKYSKEGAKIHLASEIKNNLITITVKDYGIGIPEDEQKNIFGRFYRARNALNFEGTGLGLHIVEKNVKLFNGKISFTSELNGGTEFTVILPNGNK